jgi:hypothetical protein
VNPEYQVGQLGCPNPSANPVGVVQALCLSPGGTLPALFLLAAFAAGLLGATTIDGVILLKSWWQRVRTRLSGILHPITLSVIVIALGPVAKRIPLASLAAILMAAVNSPLSLAGAKNLRSQIRAVPRKTPLALDLSDLATVYETGALPT